MHDFFYLIKGPLHIIRFTATWALHASTIATPRLSLGPRDLLYHSRSRVVNFLINKRLKFRGRDKNWIKTRMITMKKKKKKKRSDPSIVTVFFIKCTASPFAMSSARENRNRWHVSLLLCCYVRVGQRKQIMCIVVCSAFLKLRRMTFIGIKKNVFLKAYHRAENPHFRGFYTRVRIQTKQSFSYRIKIKPNM